AARAAHPARRASRLAVPCAPAPRVTIIIPTYGQAACTLRCLASIAAHPPRAPVEIVVIDDASGDPAVAALARVRGLRFVTQARNLGYLLTCNAAAAGARGAFLMLLNNDTEVRDGWLDALLEALDRDPRAAAAGSKLLHPDGRLQEAGGILWADGSGWNYGRGDDPGRPEYNYVREADWCSAASLLVRRDAWDALGGFDPVYAPAYCEDSDLAFRLRARGRTVLYVPTSVVVHHEGTTHGTDTSRGLKAFQTRNQQILRRRWAGALADHYPNGDHVARARDRARDRRVTLVLDHLVPEPDRDAGSRTMDAFLTALQDAGDVVKFWPQNRHRTPGYAARLEARGIEVLYGTTPFAEWLATRGGAVDRVLASRPAVADALLPDLLGLLRVPVVYYGHDLHHVRLRAQAALLPPGAARDALLAEAARQEAEEHRAWALADVVLYPSEEEAAAVRALRPGTDARAVVPYAFDSFDPP
ncbi:glycosyltransferase family 2 protein, partial [Acidisphaera rubrifaciens]|uniref:glycosyltransferase family 2 protein n=1 Tax=Acidisphaera rubrifaciens TaxID=50715 RepID=UPI0006620F4A